MNNNPITKVYLLDVPLENDYKNTLYFTDLASQQAYFQSRIVKSYTNFTYQRKDFMIRVPEIYDNIYNCNYVMYQNSNYSNKWFYAFIKEMKYISDGLTEIIIETDVIQTWYFDYQVKASFVEREHTNNDSIGKHTVPEGLETGEYIINNYYRDVTLCEDPKLVMGSTEAPSGEGAFYGAIYNGIYSGVKYYTYNEEDLTTNLQYLANNSKIDAVSSLFMAPNFIVPEEGGGGVSESTTCQTYELGINKFSTLNGYTPRNNKLLCYPYCYYLLSNGSGSDAILYPEKFNTPNSQPGNILRVYGALTPGCSIKCVPLYYNGVEVNIEESINLGKYPQLNWATDMYINWLTQNGVNVATNLMSGAVSSGIGIATGNPLMATGGAVQIGNALAESYKATLIPPQTRGNINCGDVLTSMEYNTFHIYNMSVKREFAEIIDGYFDMFGYRVNSVKIPNKAHRSRWWYTKTIDVNIDGDIPNDDMGKIKNAYNNGITFWRNASEIQNYSLSNGIV